MIIPNNDVSVSTDSTPSNSPFSPSVVPCPIPDIPNSVTDDAAPLSPDTELTVVCLDNYQLVGTTVSCVSGSKFSGDLPQCSGTGRGFFLGMALFMFIWIHKTFLIKSKTLVFSKKDNHDYYFPYHLRGVQALNFWEQFFEIMVYPKGPSDWPKNDWLMAKKNMPLNGIIGILRAILAKYQYFSMRPSLFDKYHQITHSMQFSVENNLKWPHLKMSVLTNGCHIFLNNSKAFWACVMSFSHKL